MIVLSLSRNFGEHNAVMAGLARARGAYAITMDDDLQNPPEEVVKLYDHTRLSGLDLVYTRYAEKAHAGWRNLGSRFANWVADSLLDKPKGLYLSSFRCMSALVVRSVTRYRGPYPYVDGLIMEVTQRIDSIEVRHLPRAEAVSGQATHRRGHRPPGDQGGMQARAALGLDSDQRDAARRMPGGDPAQQPTAAHRNEQMGEAGRLALPFQRQQCAAVEPD